MQGTTFLETKNAYFCISIMAFLIKGIVASDPIAIIEQNNTNASSSGDTALNESSIFQPFGSLHTLEKLAFWAFKEEDIYDRLRLRRVKIKAEIELIKMYITEYEATSATAFAATQVPLVSAADRGRFAGGSPVLAHRMTDRYTGVIHDLQEHLHSDDYWLVAEDMIHILDIETSPEHNDSNPLKWPEQNDLFVSHISLLEIQNFYAIEQDMLFQGVALETEFGGTLNTTHCLLMGILALRLSHYFRAVEWLEFTMAYIKLKNISSDESVSVDLATKLTKMAIQEHNYQLNNWNPEALMKQFLYQKYYAFIHFFVNPAKFGENWVDREHSRDRHLRSFGQTYGNQSNSILNMFTVCMGRDLQPQHIKARLYCYLENKRHPYFILNPVKTEQLSEYPYIVQFYDVLGKNTIDDLYKFRGELHVSTVFGSKDIEDTLSVRSSAGSVPNKEFVYKIQNKTELLTGLLLTDLLEGIQTAEYVYGRFYKTHHDPISEPGFPVNVSTDYSLETGGDRVATLLYYIDEATEGGDTAFGEVGISTRTIRGSAVFWLNMNRNGIIRTDTSHTACPVIHGQKTIINQWIRYNVNFQRFKCSLDPSQ